MAAQLRLGAFGAPLGPRSPSCAYTITTGRFSFHLAASLSRRFFGAIRAEAQLGLRAPRGLPTEQDLTHREITSRDSAVH